MDKKIVSLNTSTFAQFSKEPLSLLKKSGFDYRLNKYGRKLSENEIIEVTKDCIAVIAGTEKFSKKVINNLPDLKIISRLGVGVDNIDKNHAKKKNIKIICTNTTPAIGVAELVIGLILDISRGITSHNNDLKSKKWNKRVGQLFSNKKLGIIGFGRIGKELVNATQGFNLNYIVYDPHLNKEIKLSKKIKKSSLDQLLMESDIVSLHVSLNENNFGMINNKCLKLMKDDSILINTSRGELIDEKALEFFLERKKFKGVGLDVFNNEPYYGNLIKFKNVITTPHIGSYAKELRIKMEIEAVKNIINNLN